MKYFKIFKSINKPIIQQNENSKKSFLVVDRERIVHAFFMSILSSVISIKKKYKPILIGDFYKRNKTNYETFKSFGFQNIINIMHSKFMIYNPLITLKTFIYSTKAIYLIKKNGYFWFIKSFKVYKILIGDLIFDTLGKHNIADKRINYHKFKILFVAIYRTIKISNLITNNNVKVIVVPTETYCYNSGIACRIGLTKKLKVITPHDNNYLETQTFKKILYGHSNILYNNLLGEVKKIKNISKVEKFLQDRKNLKAKTYYTNNSDLKNANNFKALNLNKEEFIKSYFKKNNFDQKVILVACHAFSDATNGLGTRLIFKDYYEWAKETLNYINKLKNKDVLFILKNHPSSRFDDRLLIKKLLDSCDNDKIILCPKKINTNDLIKICDNVITARGTIAMEFAINGKFPIICGSATYSGLGIALECSSKSKYFNLLKRLRHLPKMDDRKKLLAKKVLYFMEHYQLNRLPKLNDKKLVLNYKIISNSKFSNQYNIFCKELIVNMKRIGFENDDLYKDFLKRVEF